jgi:serine/threonine-protein kinase
MTTALPDIPGYEYLRPLGEGGMGRVFLARHKATGREQVIKLVRAELMTHGNTADRFLREVRIASMLRHPNIIGFHDAWARDGVAYLAIEYFPGRDLYAWCNRRPVPRPSDVARLGWQIASGLAAAHAKNVIHRDIKPQNILLSEAGIVKIIDFGLARAIRPTASDALTAMGTVLGSPFCMAPEQISDPDHIDHRIDLYAAGVVLYFCLTGRFPYQGAHALEVVRQIGRPFPAPRELRPETPPALEQVLM